MPGKPLVKGEILFEKDVPSFSGAAVYIRLEDVSRMDAPSKVISEQVIRNVKYDSISHSRIAFALHAKIPDTKARYAISVHVDLDGNGKLNVGDFINMESYPVLTHGYPNNVLVRVRQIK